MADPVAFDPSLLRGLVVDDNPQMREIVRSILRAFGVDDVTVAVDGSDALAKMEDGRFDFVICDWLMAPMDGLTFVRRVRANPAPAVRATPVLMLTAQAGRQNVIDARAAGVDGYLAKPVSSAQLWARLQPIAAKGISARRLDETASSRAIAAADGGLTHMAVAYREVLRLDCEDLSRGLALLLLSDWNRPGMWETLFKKAHDVKGQAGSFGYTLATDVAGRLCDSLRCVREDFARRNTRAAVLKKVLEASVGALELVARENMTGDGGPEGRELLMQIDGNLQDLRAAWGIPA